VSHLVGRQTGPSNANENYREMSANDPLRTFNDTLTYKCNPNWYDYSWQGTWTRPTLAVSFRDAEVNRLHAGS
jgi:hypothetical protein